MYILYGFDKLYLYNIIKFVNTNIWLTILCLQNS